MHGVLTLPRQPGPVLTVFCLLHSTLVGCRQGTGPAGPPRVETPAPLQKGSPTIDFDSRVHDFGVVNDGTALKHVFTVKNTGTSPLELTNVSTSCGCTAATLGVHEVPPGRSGPIEVTFDTHGFQGIGSKTIMVASNDKQNPTSSLQIKYDVERLLAFESAFVRLASKRGGAFVEKVWLTGKLVDQAKPRVAKVEGGDKQVLVKTIQARQQGEIRKGLEIELKGTKQVSGDGAITIATGLPNPAQLVLRFSVTVD